MEDEYPSWVVAFAAFCVWFAGLVALYGVFAFTAWDGDFQDWNTFGRLVYALLGLAWTVAVWESAEFADDGEE